MQATRSTVCTPLLGHVSIFPLIYGRPETGSDKLQFYGCALQDISLEIDIVKEVCHIEEEFDAVCCILPPCGGSIGYAPPQSL